LDVLKTRLNTAREFQRGEYSVKHLSYFLVAFSLFAPGVLAQDYSDHINAGIFGDFLHLEPGGTNLAGVGARLSANVLPVVQIEAETAYTFDQSFVYGSGAFGSGSFARTDLRSIDLLVGPKLETNKGPVRFFVTAKGGFINFLLSSSPATVGTFTNTFAGLNGHDLNAVFYPGGGAEAFWGPFGLRVDVGDEIYFNNGGHNNLKITFGPTIRF
jgi:hypothetical protein